MPDVDRQKKSSEKLRHDKTDGRGYACQGSIPLLCSVHWWSGLVCTLCPPAYCTQSVGLEQIHTCFPWRAGQDERRGWRLFRTLANSKPDGHYSALSFIRYCEIPWNSDKSYSLSDIFPDLSLNDGEECALRVWRIYSNIRIFSIQRFIRTFIRINFLDTNIFRYSFVSIFKFCRCFCLISIEITLCLWIFCW